ncbi:glyoxylate/hydroxypyruvate reductase A [Herbaspirillum sp. Sphag1AN]|uniref:2-hydroxyacid dehydrogenase n=1 Tax=unclassified Herbaspirillum TaxID=2624150 RepID=UPI00161FB708|nr:MULTISPECIES: glyoxylate/hydroxypyruvate reductase A [unclassified Herbaspirillum]MBB3213862.1 glyoxylate/hydroxypyruvate reductase A [Herbaspirillum sp. Sphag1AN]MBB3247059.1 glyoxylate/hydroxypyruvate reductase A [Herbaspirillum sp. Sphag64]
MSFLYKADPVRGAEWAQLFAAKAPDIPFYCWPDTGDRNAVRYLAAWLPPADITSEFPHLEIVFSVGAGIDQFDFSSLPTHLPVVRMVEPGIAAGMVEYVTHAVLGIHRQSRLYARQQQAHVWQAHRVRPASDTRVGVLGLGMLGRAVLQQLAGMGFSCAGWSRSAHSLEGVTCYSGDDGLSAFLARSDILICLLPLTAETRGILNQAVFAQLPAGASVINVGRGGHLVEADLLAALESGHLAGAVLDVCEHEPLSAQHPFWSHPEIVITPHIASMTQPAGAVDLVLENIRRHQAGLPLLGLVDRTRGY